MSPRAWKLHANQRRSARCVPGLVAMPNKRYVQGDQLRTFAASVSGDVTVEERRPQQRRSGPISFLSGRFNWAGAENSELTCGEKRMTFRLLGWSAEYGQGHPG